MSKIIPCWAARPYTYAAWQFTGPLPPDWADRPDVRIVDGLRVEVLPSSRKAVA